MIKHLLTIILFFSFIFNANAMELYQASPSNSFGNKAFQLSLTIAFGLSALAISTFAHEYGHAFMAKFLTGSPLDINIGANSGSFNKPVAKIGCVTLYGWNLFRGHAKFKKEPSSKTGRILLNLAGPLAGAAVTLLIYKLSKDPLLKLICLSCTVDQVLGNLNPGSSIANKNRTLFQYSDGAHVLSECIGYKKTNKIVSILNHPIAKCSFSVAEIAILLKMGIVDLFKEYIKQIEK